MNHDLLIEKVLGALNSQQKQAVTASPVGVLQVIAGPGTGKTKVIVLRVAYLLLHEGILPEDVIVTTFTKKAANEMMERLRSIFMGTEVIIGKLLIGTFHSLCFKIILKYGFLMGLEGYSIADEADSLQMLNTVLDQRMTDADWLVLESYPDEYLNALKVKSDSTKHMGIDAKKVKAQISKLKAAGITPDAYACSSERNKILSFLYDLYQAELNANKLLDFDDCLLQCYRIVSQHNVLQNIKHTLVDEFQDTNEIQLQLMYKLCHNKRTNSLNVTIVGDPDQSIYAFRDAQSINFSKMKQYYTTMHSMEVKEITLNENYRSTADILDISEKLMRQQKDRIRKDLRSQSSLSMKPVLANLSHLEHEARWIAHHILLLQALPKGMVLLSDIAILVRSAYQTRAIEMELVRKKILYKVVRGKEFWNRKEVVAVINYMRCISNFDDKLAWLRVLNFPKRGFGPKSIEDLDAIITRRRQADTSRLVFEILRRVADSRCPSSLGPKLKCTLTTFLDTMQALNDFLASQFDPEGDNEAVLTDFYKQLVTKSDLGREFGDDINCELNMNEVRSQLLAFRYIHDDSLPDHPDNTSEEEVIDGPLIVKRFIELISLHEAKDETEGEAAPRVSISTIHGSKGLEWPIVFVPGVSEGLLPASFAIDEAVPETLNEERRCFYVATSRAKSLLFLSSYTEPENGGKWGRKPIKNASRFLESIAGCCAKRFTIENQSYADTLFSLFGKETSPEFDVKRFQTSQDQLYSTYVDQEVQEPEMDGFTTAGRVKSEQKPPGMAQWSRRTTKVSSLSALSSKGDKSLGKAPTYVPLRAGPRMPQSFKAPRVSQPTQVTQRPAQVTEQPAQSELKRAPAYIPLRCGNKRRLGTR